MMFHFRSTGLAKHDPYFSADFACRGWLRFRYVEFFKKYDKTVGSAPFIFAHSLVAPGRGLVDHNIKECIFKGALSEKAY